MGFIIGVIALLGALIRLELYGTEVSGIVFGEHNAFHGLTVVQIDGDYIDFGW